MGDGLPRARRRALWVGAAAVGLAGLLAVTSVTSEPSPEALPPLAERVLVGAYVHRSGGVPSDPRDVRALEGELGGTLDIVNDFVSWGRSFDSVTSDLFPDRTLMISWKPDPGVMGSLPTGAHDAYLDEFARQAGAYGHPVYLRLAYEMNGEWNDHSAASANGPAADVWASSWRHAVARFRQAGASNVRFVWAPNEVDFPDVPGNRLEDYWPGADAVDVVAFDAYNWSTGQPRRGDGSWRSFDEIVAEPYERLRRLPGAEDKPVWLTEFGTTEATPTDPPTASKARWLQEMLSSRRWPDLEAVVYFSEDDQRDTQRDWRLDSSSESARAFREAWTAGGRDTGPTPAP